VSAVIGVLANRGEQPSREESKPNRAFVQVLERAGVWLNLTTVWDMSKEKIPGVIGKDVIIEVSEGTGNFAGQKTYWGPSGGNGEVDPLKALFPDRADIVKGKGADGKAPF
jgi:hypothetical protein